MPANYPLKTCHTCGNEYSEIKLNNILSRLKKETVLPVPIYYDTCLDCILSSLNDLKAEYLPELKEAQTAYNALNKALKRATIRKNTIERKYKLADQQHAYIKFFMRQAQTEACKPRKAHSHKPRKPVDPALEKLISKLSQEQLAKIIEVSKTN